MKRAKTKKLTPVRQDVIVSYLRDPIVRGKLQPGDRLPTQAEIIAKFGSSPLTVKRACRQVIADGFARSVPKIGTFVAERLPHLSRYAVVFVGSPANEPPGTWSRFDEAIVRASDVIAAERGISFTHFYNLAGHTDSESYQTLLRDVENQRLAGIIFTFTPFLLQSTTLLEHTTPPRVIPGQDTGIPIPGRRIDHKHFMYRALDAFEADGRRRIAVVTQPQFAWGFPDEFISAVKSRGMIMHPFWMQAVEPRHPFWVRHAVHAILSAHAHELPDALLVTDDHLVEAVADALAEFNLRVPQDIRVIGHWNFPLTYRGVVPIDLLGFDARELLRLQIDAIDAQRRGESIPRFASIKAHFASEMPCDAEPSRKHPAGELAKHRSISEERAR